MKVVCPHCNFEREIPDDKIPENARLATCPKCQHKFYFRDLEDQYDDAENAYGESDNYIRYQNSDDSIQNESSSLKTEEDYYHRESDKDYHDAPTENGEEHMYNPDETIHQDASYRKQDYHEPESERKQENEDNDLWQKLDRMVPKNDDLNEEDETEDIYEGYFFDDIPFENPEKYGFFKAVGLTIKRVLTKPVQFFKEMPLSGFMKPLVFFLVLAEFQAVFEFFWENIVGLNSSVMQNINTAAGSGMNSALTASSGEVLVSLLLFPILITLVSFPTAGLTHAMLMVFGSGKKGFEATYRATTYSYAAAVFSIIPIAGPLIASALSMMISVVAYKNIHDSTYTRVIMAMLAPTVIFLILALLYFRMNQPTI